LSSHKPSFQEAIDRMKKLASTHPKVKIIDTYLSEEEKSKLYHRTGVALCASAREGFGHYILEAASYGCQVVTTDGFPMSEILETQVYLATAKRKLPDDDSLWGFRYECKKDEIKQACYAALSVTMNPSEAKGNIRRRKRMFLEDFKSFLTNANIVEHERPSAWEMF